MADLNQYTGTWTIDPTHTRLGFVARHAMVTKVRGSFTDFEGSLTLDGANPAASSISLTAQLTSIDTGNADRDNHVRSADFFDVENNPTMTFASTSVKQSDDDEFVLVGDLTIKGVTKPVTLKVEHFTTMTHPMLKKDAIGANASTLIKRSDFNAGKYAPNVGDEVTIRVAIEAIKG